MSNLKKFLEKNDIQEGDVFRHDELIKYLSDYSSMNNQALSVKLKEAKNSSMIVGDKIDAVRSIGTHINVLRDIVKCISLTNHYLSNFHFWAAGGMVGSAIALWGIFIIMLLNFIFA